MGPELERTSEGSPLPPGAEAGAEPCAAGMDAAGPEQPASAAASIADAKNAKLFSLCCPFFRFSRLIFGLVRNDLKWKRDRGGSPLRGPAGKPAERDLCVQVVAGQPNAVSFDHIVHQAADLVDGQFAAGMGSSIAA